LIYLIARLTAFVKSKGAKEKIAVRS
jgi:hypothetical protein